MAALRRHAYPPLAAVANRWMEALGARERYPDDLPGLPARCRRAGQRKPTPLLLHYEAGGYNCLHRDLYGEVAFPLQPTCSLSAGFARAIRSSRGKDSEGGKAPLRRKLEAPPEGRGEGLDGAPLRPGLQRQVGGEAVEEAGVPAP